MDHALSVFFWHRAFSNPILIAGLVALLPLLIHGFGICRKAPREQWLSLLMAVRISSWPVRLAVIGVLAFCGGLSQVNSDVRDVREILARNFFVQVEFGSSGLDRLALSCPPFGPGAAPAPVVTLSAAELRLLKDSIQVEDAGPRDEFVARRLADVGGLPATSVSSR